MTNDLRLRKTFGRLTVSLFVVCIWAALIATSQTHRVGTKPKDKKTLKSEIDEEKIRRDLEIQNLILAAKSQTTEVSADILFEVLNSKLLKDPRKEEELIEEIFRNASGAKEPFKMVYHDGLADTRSGFRGMAFELKLDRLSIQLRAIKMLLPLNRAKAIGLFREIPPLKVPALTCNDDLEYDLNDFYTVLKTIVETGFDAEAQQRKENINFVSSYIEAIDSPSQLRPVVNLVSSLKLTAQDFDRIVRNFSVALKSVSGDPRSVSLSLNQARLSSEIKDNLLRKTDENYAQQDDLLRSYRTYIVRNLSSRQCADTLIAGTEDKPHPIISYANTLFKNPVRPDETKPETVESRSSQYAYWRSTKAAKLLSQAKSLRFGTAKSELTSEERSSQEWQTRLFEFLHEMDQWNPEDEETEADYFHQKSVLFNGLIGLTSNEMRLDILRQFTLFLRDSRVQKENPAQWLYYVKQLFRTGKTLEVKDRDSFFDTATRSGNTVLAMYVDLDKIRNRPPLLSSRDSTRASYMWPVIFSMRSTKP